MESGRDELTLATAELYDPDTGIFQRRGIDGDRQVPPHGDAACGRQGPVDGRNRLGWDRPRHGGAVRPRYADVRRHGVHGDRQEQHIATPLADGKVLMVGGASGVPGGVETALSSVELHDPASGTFSAVGSMASARYEHSATLLSSGKVLVAGGRTGSAATSLPTASCTIPTRGRSPLSGVPMVESRAGTHVYAACRAAMS